MESRKGELQPLRVVRYQRYTEITHDPLLFSVAQEKFCTERLSRSTLHLKEGGEGSLYPCTL
jgi:hypothetical protein